MAVYFSTRSPQALLDEFKKHISEGRVTTWEFDADGDFSPSLRQWNDAGWMVPAVEDGRLAFYILHRKGEVISTSAYAVFHGRLIESMLRFCDKLISEGRVTSFPEGRDRIQEK